MRRPARWIVVAVALVACFVVAAPPAFGAKKPARVSGSVNVEGSKNLTGDDAATLDVSLDDFFISPTFTKATPGQQITVNITNDGRTTHTFTSQSLGVEVELAPGKSQSLEIPMPEKKGAYLVYCRIHRSAGMQGALWSKRGAKASNTPEPDATT